MNLVKRKYKVLIIIGAVLVVLVVAGVIVFSGIQKSLEALKSVEIEDVDLSQVEDGTYTGSYSSFPLSAEVSVTVSGHAITDIKLVKHSHGPDHGADAITDKVVDSQSLQVDSVSGATYSSKVILLAIEDALKKGKG
jgi:uncharacterized protein with FMN-binding domain